MKKRVISILLITVMICSLLGVTASAESLTENKAEIYSIITNELGYNQAAACGIMANICYESGFYTNINTRGYYGLFQLSASLFNTLKKWCGENGQDYSTCRGQVLFVGALLRGEVSGNNYSGLGNTLKNVENTQDGAYDAGYAFCSQFERPSNIAYSSNKRGTYAANTLFPAYADITIVSTEEIKETAVGYTGTVTASALNVRKGPGMNYAVMSMLPRGRSVTVEAEAVDSANNTWCKLTGSGWVSKQYIAVSTSAETTLMIAVPASTDTSAENTATAVDENNSNNAEMSQTAASDAAKTDTGTSITGTEYTVTTPKGLNVRSGAGMNYKILRCVGYRHTVYVIAEKTSGGIRWAQLSDGGWVCRDYLEATGSTMSVQTAASNESTGAEEAAQSDTSESEGDDDDYKVTASALRIRSGAGTDYSIIGLLYNGDTIVIVDTAFDKEGSLWGQLESGYWICMTYVKEI